MSGSVLTGTFLKYSFPWVHFWCSCAWLTRVQFILLKQMFQTLPMDFPLSGFKGLFSCGLMLHYVIIHVLKVLVKWHFLWSLLHHYMKGHSLNRIFHTYIQYLFPRWQLVVAASHFECMHRILYSCMTRMASFKALECCLEFKNDSCQPEERYSTQQELNDGPAKESTGLRF